MSRTMLLLLAALGAELLVLLFVLLFVSWLRNRAARLRDAKAVQALIARVKQAKPEREAAIGKFLASRFQMSGEPLAQTRHALVRAELQLLQRFAGIYRGRDAGAAARFDIDLVAAVDPYHALKGGSEGGAEAYGGETELDTTEIELLREDNRRLADELQVTMETMSRMLNEYSTMFAGGRPDDEERAAAPPVAGPAADGAAGAETRPADDRGAQVLATADITADPDRPLDQAGAGGVADDEPGPFAADATDDLFDEPVRDAQEPGASSIRSMDPVGADASAAVVAAGGPFPGQDVLAEIPDPEETTEPAAFDVDVMGAGSPTPADAGPQPQQDGQPSIDEADGLADFNADGAPGGIAGEDWFDAAAIDVGPSQVGEAEGGDRDDRSSGAGAADASHESSKTRTVP